MTSCLLPWITKPFTNWVYSESKEFAPIGANSFLSEMTPFETGGKMEKEELLPLKEYPFTLMRVATGQGRFL